ncbi:unnamed protein product [Urochloa humidicola]
MDGGGGERARRAHHDAIYGIFAEGNSDCDSDDDGSHRRKRRREATESDLSKPVRFVSIGYDTPSQEPEHVPVNSAAKEEDAMAEVDIEPLPAMFGKISEGARARREEKERERDAAGGSGEPAVQLHGGQDDGDDGRNFGTGLGKDGQGITEPLEATARTKNAGLSYVDRSKKHPAKENLPPPTRPPATAAPTKERQPRWAGRD